MRCFLAPQHFDADGVRAPGVSSLSPTLLVPGMQIHWPIGIMVRVVSEQVDRTWTRKELAIVPPDELDLHGLYAHLVFGRKQDGTPAEIHRVVPVRGAELHWKQVEVTQIPDSRLKESLVIASGDGWYYPASYRAVVSLPDRYAGQAPSSWQEVEV